MSDGPQPAPTPLCVARGSRDANAPTWAVRFSPKVQRFYQRQEAKSHLMVARKALAHNQRFWALSPTDQQAVIEFLKQL